MIDDTLSIRNFFNHAYDIVHFLLGLITYLLLVCVSNWIALIVFLIFIIYQTLDRETKLESTADILEYFIGFAVGFLIIPI